MAWHVIQELGFVLNYISLEERLPTVFMPVSPPPYLNGGPDGCLGWVIESTHPEFEPVDALWALQERLPDPPTKLAGWPPCDGGRCPLRALHKDDA
jgi:hypothetical protein